MSSLPAVSPKAPHSAHVGAQKPAQQTAREREQQLLAGLHRFGYLTAAQIGVLLYSSATQPLRLAQRLTQRMRAAGLLITHDGGFGIHDLHGLSAAGARRLAAYTGQAVESGKDVMREPSAHRIAANWSAIVLLREGWPQVWTERQIQTGRAPFRQFFNKVPDVCACDEDGSVTWIEIEHSRRGGRDMARLATWLSRYAFPAGAELASLNPPQDTLFLERVRFVLCVQEALSFPQRLQRQVERVLGDQFEPDAWSTRIEFQSLINPMQPSQVMLGWQ